MKTILLLALTIGFVVSALAGCAEEPGDNIPPAYASGWTTPAKKTMRPFRSEQELASYFRELAEKQKRERQAMREKLEPASPLAGVANSADANL